ncbi:MAG: CCA tRNA nucleotidyltransferase [Thermoplasmata archaeon]|nr:CCA tRNA nucleotidyltransferase [Thermoplasmata archaeon]
MENDLNQAILIEIIPSAAENKRISEIVDELHHRIFEAIQELKLDINIEPILVGSVAKATHLTNPDIDIFMMFPKITPRADLENIALQIGKLVIPEGQERYAEHPYISGNYKDFQIDVVPCYRITDASELKSAVDRTPFHTEYIKANLAQDLISDVLLLKQFMKGIGVYGAEVEVQGFSGYLCELLIKYYNGFQPLLEAAKVWVLPEFINMESEPEPKAINDEFKNDPLIFIDPVDPNRNVASALSQENFELFKSACGAYCESPAREFFFPNPIPPLSESELIEAITERSTKFIAIAFKTPEVIPDILYSQLRKARKAINKLCETKGFQVQDSDFTVVANQTSIILFEFKIYVLPEDELHHGPPDGNKNVESFIAKWRDSESALSEPYLDEQAQRWKVKIQRQFREAQDLIGAEISGLSLGKHINFEVQKSYELLMDKDIVRPEHQEFLTQFLLKKYPWEY